MGEDQLRHMRKAAIANFLHKYTVPRSFYDGIRETEMAEVLMEKLAQVDADFDTMQHELNGLTEHYENTPFDEVGDGPRAL